jgi:multiple sugar transport system substrate-binding protein
MKKLLLMLVVVQVLVSACSENKGSSSAVDSGGSAGITAEISGPPKFIEDDKTIAGTVKFWIPFSGPQGMDLMIEEFNTIYPNIKVELNTYNNNSNGNLAVNTAMMAGEVDVLHSFGLVNAFRRWEGGLYRDITDDIAADNIDLSAEFGSDVYKYDDRIYTLPSGSLSYYIAINMTEWKNAGLGEIPKAWTWDEYLMASKAMTHGLGNDKVYGGSDYHSQWYVLLPIAQKYGKDPYYNGEGLSSTSDPLFLKALKREIKAEQEDQIWFPLTRYRSDNLQGQMTYLNHQVASVIICNLQRFLRDTKTYPVDWVTAFAPYPTEEPGEVNHVEGVSIFSHVGIASQSPESNYKANYAFLKWYASEGCKYLVLAGHLPSWKKTDVNAMLPLIFGSDEETAKLVDVESFKRVVFNYTAPNWVETNLTAYNEVASFFNEYIMYSHNGEMTPEAAVAELQKEADAAIKDAR